MKVMEEQQDIAAEARARSKLKAIKPLEISVL